MMIVEALPRGATHQDTVSWLASSLQRVADAVRTRIVEADNLATGATIRLWDGDATDAASNHRVAVFPRWPGDGFLQV